MANVQRQGSLLAVLLLGLVVGGSWGETRICLNMIAKNEAKEILDCLKPLAAELSGWTLCDTGSTDDTIEIVQDFFKKDAIPGAVANHKWQDFGHNRNLCIKEGLQWSQKEAKRQGVDGQHWCEYLLFLDADQILQRPSDVQPGDLKAMDLKHDGYHMTEKGVGVTYQNMRLVSTRVEWEWVGEVHEFVHRKDGVHGGQHIVPGLWFSHDATGGQDGKRFVRDEEILSKAVRQRPADTRARFYLANTLRALSKWEEAIKHYAERIRLGGWEEEKFMSALNIADIMKRQLTDGEVVSPVAQAALGNWDSHHKQASAAVEELEAKQYQAALANVTAAKEAAAASKEGGEATDKQDGSKDAALQKAQSVLDRIKESRKHRQFPLVVAAYMAAASILPYRPEPWVNLAKLYRIEKGDNERCFNYAAAAIAQGKPRQDALFINTYHVDYEALDEMCACAYYVDNQLEQGRVACRQLEQKVAAHMLQTPDSQYLKLMLKRAKDNLGWYARKAPENALEGECPADSLCSTKNKVSFA